MEDQFANILQRNYGLKAVGKSASLGPRSEDRASASARALDRGKSVGSGLGRLNQSAAAAVEATGVVSTHEHNNGMSKSSAASAYGSSAGDQGFRGPAQNRSSSVGGFDDIFNGSKSGSASSSSFAEFLDGKGSFGKSMPRSSDSPYSEDVPAVSYQGSRSRTTEQAGQSANEEEGLRDWSGRRGSGRSGDSRRSTEEDFLDSLNSREARTSHHVSGYDSLKVQTPVSLESESPLKGSFMSIVGRSRSRSAQYSPRTVEVPVEGTGGDGSNGVLGSSRLNVESNHKAMSGVSSSESESGGRVDQPASNGSAFLDLNKPYTPPGMELPARRLREVKVSNGEPSTVDSKYPLSPKTPAPDSAKSKDSPSSGPGPFGGEGQSSHGVGTEEGVPMRRAFDMNSVDSPMASPSFVHRSRRSGRANVTGHANGLEDEPLMNLASGGAMRRGRRRTDLLTEVWLTVDQIRLVTKPSTYPPPSRPPPALPSPVVRENVGGSRQELRPKPRGPETPRPEDDARSAPLATESKQQQQQQHASPRSESSGPESVHPSQKVHARPDVDRFKQAQTSRSERVNGGGVQKQHGFVLPEVTVEEIGAEIHQKPEIHQRPVPREPEIHQKPITREDREKLVAQIDRAARRAKREEERLKEKERLKEREGQSQSPFTDPEVREPSRPRDRRDKVFAPKERQPQEMVTQKEEESQYRLQRQQARDLQQRLGRHEETRDRESERSADRMRRSAEKAAIEAQDRAERAAVERAVQEAHERAEKAARQRAAAARMKEKERERERERDREEEKLRDRLREKERGLAEQLRSRDNFRATSEPRQRPNVSNVNLPSGGGLSRFSSGGNLNKYSVSGDSRKSPSSRASKQWGAPIPEKFQEIPGEPADRRKLRLDKQLMIEERAARALQEKNMRDLALQREQEERQRFASVLDADVKRWSVGKEGNLRALLSTLHMMLWAECNWKVVSMTDLASGPAVKKAYQRAILCVHPDKVQQKGANVKQKYIAEKVFDLLKDAYAKFNNEL